MKIVCDNCSTKYSIADEKVRGKVFKIKCKKCGHIIVVKGAEGAEAAPPPAGFDQKETRVFDYSGFDGPGEAVWHLVIDREQVGPLGPQDLQTKWAAGEIDGETYGWKEGMGDWLRLAAIPELAFLQGGTGAAPPQATSGEAGGLFGPPDTSSASTGRADPADLFAAAAAGGEDDGGGDLFGSRAPAGDFAAAPAPLAAAPAPSVRKSVPISKDDLFSGAPSGGGMGMAASEAPAASGGSKGMTGQRNENSVLFSLNNLAALASEAPKTSSSAPSPAFQSGGGTEGSGLIDIRAMAAMTLGPKKDDGGRPGASAAAIDDLPVFSSNSFSAPASGVLLPSVQGRGGGSNKVIIILAALIGVLVIAGVSIVVIMLKSNRQVQAVNTAAPAGDSAAGNLPPGGDKMGAAEGGAGGDKPGTPEGGAVPGTPGTPEGGTPPAAGTPEGGTPEGGAKPDEEKKPTEAKKPREDRPRERPTEVKRPPVEEKKPPKETAKCDEVSCAIDPSLPCCKKSTGGGEKKPTGGSDLPASLGRDDIKAGMSTVKGRVAQCNDQYKTPGMVTVKISINGDGQVTGAQVTGKFAGTPAGACVEKAVKNARFKKWRGPSVGVTYPFQFQ